jgi:hypothetical protein
LKRAISRKRDAASGFAPQAVWRCASPAAVIFVYAGGFLVDIPKARDGFRKDSADTFNAAFPVGAAQNPRFAPFFVTQFLGAFNDNLYKNALIVLLTFHAASWTTLAPEVLTNLAGGIFILPFFLFSATSGQLATSTTRRCWRGWVEGAGDVIMGVAALGFFLHSLSVLLGALCLLGLHSTLFGPVKYAILPQHLARTNWSAATRWSSRAPSSPFSSARWPAVCSPESADIRRGSRLPACWWPRRGSLASRGIPAAPAPAPELKVNLNPLSETWRNIGFARHNRTVFLSILGISWFWLYGALFLAQFPVFAKNVLGGDETSGDLAAGDLHRRHRPRFDALREALRQARRNRAGAVRVDRADAVRHRSLLRLAGGGAGCRAPLALASLLAEPGVWRVLFDLFALGLFGGFFIVPLYVLIQMRSEPAIARASSPPTTSSTRCSWSSARWRRRAARQRRVDSDAVRHRRAVQRGGGDLHLHAGAGVHAALHRLAAGALRSTASIRRHGDIPHDGPAVLVCNHVSFVDRSSSRRRCGGRSASSWTTASSARR